MTRVSALLLRPGRLPVVPAMLVVASRGRRFTRDAAGITVVALVNFSAPMAGDTADLSARQVLGQGPADRVAGALGGLSFFTFGWALPGMVLSLLGLTAVPIGAAVDRLTRWWVPVLAVAGVAMFQFVPLGPPG